MRSLPQIAGAMLATFMLLQSAEAAQARPAAQRIAMETDLGGIVIEIYPDKAPATSAAVLANVRSGRYDGAAFYRSVKADNDNSSPNIQVLQGGVISEDAPGQPIEIGHESTKMSGLRHRDGAVSLARAGLGTASADAFFISIGSQPALDFGGGRNPDGQGFAVFGQVVCGMEVVRRIHALPTTGKSRSPVMQGQILNPPVKILRVRLVEKGCRSR